MYFTVAPQIGYWEITPPADSYIDYVLNRMFKIFDYYVIIIIILVQVKLLKHWFVKKNKKEKPWDGQECCQVKRKSLLLESSVFIEIFWMVCFLGFVNLCMNAKTIGHYIWYFSMLHQIRDNPDKFSSQCGRHE